MRCRIKKLLKSARTFILPLALLLSTAADAREPEWPNYIYPHVVHMWSGGEWKLGPYKGRYRFTLTEDNEAEKFNHLFVERIALYMREDDANWVRVPENLVVELAWIVELSKPPGHKFDMPTCNDPPICNNFDITLRNASGETEMECKMPLTEYPEVKLICEAREN